MFYLISTIDKYSFQEVLLSMSPLILQYTSNTYNVTSNCEYFSSSSPSLPIIDDPVIHIPPTGPEPNLPPPPNIDPPPLRTSSRIRKSPSY